jgi:hypothetical protein
MIADLTGKKYSQIIFVDFPSLFLARQSINDTIHIEVKAFF